MKYLVALAILAVALTFLYVLGPREPVDLTVAIDSDAISADPFEYVAASEAGFDIRPGLEKEIVYAFPKSRAKTRIAIVYIHGFSASKNELRPVPDRIASELGANLFFTRLTGHGRDGAAMGDATVNDWINDVAEALEVGKALGERVVVMATSTGATLATLAAFQPELRPGMDAIVQISPNYRLKLPWHMSFVLDMPFGENVAELAAGPDRSFDPVNEAHEANWTSRYPVRSVMPMAATIRAVNSRHVETLDVPTLFVFDEADQVVDHSVTRDIHSRWGCAVDGWACPAEGVVGDGAAEPVERPVHVETLVGTDDPLHHVIAGDALSPSTNDAMVTVVVDWIKARQGLLVPQG